MKYDFNPFERVLVRCEADEEWLPEIFSHYTSDEWYPYGCLGGAYTECVPYKGNECLINTKNAPKASSINTIQEFKDGDFVTLLDVDMDPYAVGIFKSGDKDSTTLYVEESTGNWWYFDTVLRSVSKYIRRSTDKERELFLRDLHNSGLYWNVANKKIMPLKWEPQKGERYFFITAECGVSTSVWQGQATNSLLKVHNCFKTIFAAQVMADRVESLLMNGDV